MLRGRIVILFQLTRIVHFLLKFLSRTDAACELKFSFHLIFSVVRRLPSSAFIGRQFFTVQKTANDRDETDKQGWQHLTNYNYYLFIRRKVTSYKVDQLQKILYAGSPVRFIQGEPNKRN